MPAARSALLLLLLLLLARPGAVAQVGQRRGLSVGDRRPGAIGVVAVLEHPRCPWSRRRARS